MAPRVVLAVAGVLAVPLCSAADLCAAGTCLARDAPEEGVGLLQLDAGRRMAALAINQGGKEGEELVFTHVPYNFGHTIERVALLGPNSSLQTFGLAYGIANNSHLPLAVRQGLVSALKVPGGEVWGRLYPALNDKSDATGCVYAFTPPKYWPEELAREYFGDKKIFGMLRDPYERLVALFRGSLGDDYGGDYSEYVETCDVNGAIKKMMLDYKAGGKFAHGCTYVPQSEFFEGEYGIKLAVDNRHFPDSFNKVMEDHGYDAIEAATEDILHVTHCTESWSYQLDCETRALVQEVYKSDFELICKEFGYCDLNDNTCIHGVPMMCPQNATEGLKSDC